jgi:hypothetical protein
LSILLFFISRRSFPFKRVLTLPLRIKKCARWVTKKKKSQISQMVLALSYSCERGTSSCVAVILRL